MHMIGRVPSGTLFAGPIGKMSDRAQNAVPLLVVCLSIGMHSPNDTHTLPLSGRRQGLGRAHTADGGIGSCMRIL